MAERSQTVDYIIVGGGLTGCALASRLHQRDPSLSVLVIEAGPDASGNPDIAAALGAMKLHRTQFDWAYTTVPQKHFDNRTCYNAAGRGLSGGTLINYGAWARGDSADYDTWAKVVGDERWSFEKMLPYFRKTEHYYDGNADPRIHGFEGPIHISSILASDPDRCYPLREPLLKAWEEVGLPFNPDPNGGSTLGISEYIENFHNGQRQPSSIAYGMAGVDVLTDSLVHRVLFEKRPCGGLRASGVQLVDGRIINSKSEVIISCGTFRTPQLLMLSGIGPEEVLSQHGITQLVDAPDVGRNYFDHLALFQYFKLRGTDEGRAMGSPQWNNSAYTKGMPCDWAIYESVPDDELKPALNADGVINDPTNTILSRVHLETMVLYAPVGAFHAGVDAPMDGNYIASSVMVLLPTSRGTITLNSADPLDIPRIDGNHYATHADKCMLHSGIRRVLHVLTKTNAGKAFIESEVPPSGLPPLTPESSDEDIAARVRRAGVNHFHAAGSAAMGKVVDTELRVIGVTGLRVADASVLPTPIGGYPQACLYAIAERTADLIASS